MILPYSQYTLEEITTQHGIALEPTAFLPEVMPSPVPDWLQQMLSLGKRNLLIRTEKLVSEWFIAPILLALKEQNPRIGVFSGVALNVEGFTGTCDFIISGKPTPFILEAPIITLVEAKRQDVELGVPQCIAEMLAARVFNQKKGQPSHTVFGCVTTGDDWLFLKLNGSTVAIHNRTFYLSELEEILGVFQWMINYFYSDIPK